MRNLLLTGFMGTGKTTVGREIATRFGLRFVDMDEELERRAGRSIPEIFARDGEPEFRRLERSLLRDLLSGEGQIVATGGGTLVSGENPDLLRGDAVLCLTCEREELSRRLAGESGRPLLAGRSWDEVMELLERRRGAYDRFERVDTAGRSPQEVAEEIGRRLDLRVAGQLTVDREQQSTLLFGRGTLSCLGSTLPAYGCMGDVVLVHDEVVGSLGLPEAATGSLEDAGFPVHRAVLPSGEEHKTLDSVRALYTVCRQQRIDRQATIVGLGGGVIGDLAGMLAATYLRGLRLVLIPTTLLAQVDASIGGKVGVDLDGVKNLVGAFHPAELILADPEALRTLSDAQLADGLAEVVKIAAVRSAELFEAVESLSAPREVLAHPFIIREAAQAKVRVVERDPYERGERAMLNFGHTIGHAVEAASDYRLSHGQAVSVGMAAETRLAQLLDLCSAGVYDRLILLLQRFGLPIAASGLNPQTVFELLQQDKKRRGSETRFALPTGIGAGEIISVDGTSIKAAIAPAVGGAS